jgi:hypothetical protein
MSVMSSRPFDKPSGDWSADFVQPTKPTPPISSAATSRERSFRVIRRNVTTPAVHPDQPMSPFPKSTDRQ